MLFPFRIEISQKTYAITVGKITIQANSPNTRKDQFEFSGIIHVSIRKTRPVAAIKNGTPLDSDLFPHRLVRLEYNPHNTAAQSAAAYGNQLDFIFERNVYTETVSFCIVAAATPPNAIITPGISGHRALRRSIGTEKRIIILGHR